MVMSTEEGEPTSPLPSTEAIARVMVSSPSASRSRIGVIVVVTRVLSSATVSLGAGEVEVTAQPRGRLRWRPGQW